MPTFRATLVALSSLIAVPAIAQPVPPPPPPPPAAAPAAPAPVPPPPGPAAAPAPPPPGPAPVAPAPGEPPPAPPPEPVLDAAPPPPPPPPVEEVKAEPAFPEKLSVGKSGGFFQPGALLQFWGFLTHNEDATTSTFRIRRAEFRAKGEIAPKLVGYNVMIDAAKLLSFSTNTDGDLVPPTDTSILQDFYITFLTDYADISVGQYKTPLSYEGYSSSSKTIFPERSRVARAYGDRRDIGLRVEKKLGDVFYYYAGLFNGSGLNRADEDNEKDGALRLEVYPVPGFTIAGVAYATIGTRDEAHRDRVEADIRYEGNNFLAQAEYIHAWDTNAAGVALEGHGAYAAFGYTIMDRIQPIVRVGFLDPSVDDEDTTLRHYEGGLNYLLRGHEMKLSLVAGTFVPDVGPHTIEATLAAQVSY
jgi:hypothetical protein